MAHQLIEKEIELKEKYEKFINTEEGKEWKNSWIERYGKGFGDFGDYLYDFYPEILM